MVVQVQRRAKAPDLAGRARAALLDAGRFCELTRIGLSQCTSRLGRNASPTLRVSPFLRLGHARIQLDWREGGGIVISYSPEVGVPGVGAWSGVARTGLPSAGLTWRKEMTQESSHVRSRSIGVSAFGALALALLLGGGLASRSSASSAVMEDPIDPVEICGDCAGNGSYDVTINYPDIIFVAMSVQFAVGECWLSEISCCDPGAFGCGFRVTGVFMRGGPMGVSSLPIQTEAGAVCGGSDTGVSTHAAGTVTVTVTCEDCPENC